MSNYQLALEKFQEIGFVDTVSHPLVYIKGLPGVKPKEVVYFESGEVGLVLSLAQIYVEVLVFSKDPMRVGEKVSRGGAGLEVPVGPELLGASVNPFGKSLYDTHPGPPTKETRSIDTMVSGINARKRIDQPFITGVSVVDLLIPLGKGQRELIIGDRKTGKSIFLMQTILAQAKEGTVCIYVGIGRRKTDIRSIEGFAEKTGIRDRLVVIGATSSDPPGYVYIAPYSAMAVAECFRDAGSNVCLILDDLTSHARFYREISLLGHRFPGRGSYPGDIFYTHSKLLERAGCFKTQHGTRSITCLPVAETVEGDLSGYIQTNLMSVTDGHLYFDRSLFEEGRRPALNYLLSVTRVGRQTQSKLRWGINRELISFLTLYDKTLSFVHFGAEINEGIKATLAMGKKLFNYFDQPMGRVVPINVQIIVFCLIWLGLVGSDAGSGALMYIVERAADLYEKDPPFRNKIDSLVKESDELNILLGKVSEVSKDLTTYFNG